MAEKGMIDDAAIASNEKQAADFWLIREEISDAQTRTRGSVRCDISVPLSSISKFHPRDLSQGDGRRAVDAHGHLWPCW
ncbi:hypothetical protein ACTMU2_13045 [Cupriavidus basilensis]